MKPRRAIVCLAPLFWFAPGCDGSAYLGLEPPGWKADFETGDVSQWSEGGSGRSFASSDGQLTIVGAPVHGGRYALKCSINAAGNLSYARAAREGNLPERAYYSAWFYIPARYTVTGTYWNIFEFSGRNDPADTNGDVALWSLNLHQSGDGETVWYVRDKLRNRDLTPATPVSPPIGRWFRVLAFIEQANDQTGRAAFWVDGAPFVDERGVSTVLSNWMSWQVGGAAVDLAQRPTDIYIDDAMIWRDSGH